MSNWFAILVDWISNACQLPYFNPYLRIQFQRVGAPDEAKYECHVNSEPPQKLAICLTVQGVVIAEC